MPTTTNPTLVITSYDSYETGVKVALLKNDKLMETVGTKESFLKLMSVEQFMEMLKNAAPMFETAIAASHGFTCNTLVINTLAHYQTLVVDTDIAADAFLGACMQVLKNHKMIFNFLDKGKIDLVQKLLTATSNIAKRMEQIATDLVTVSAAAVTSAQASLDATTTANNAAIGNMKKNDKSKPKATSKMEGCQAAAKHYDDEVKTAKAALKRAEDDVCQQKRVDSNDSTYDVCWGLIKGSSLRGNENEKTRLLLERESTMRAECAEVLKKQQENNQETIDCVLELARLHEEGETEAKAIAALELTVKALGRIAASFEDMRNFWGKLKTRYSELTECDVELKSAMAEDDRTHITEDWYQWLALAKMNYEAVTGMADVKKSVHRIISDLPNSKEAEARLSGLLENLKIEVKATDALIERRIQDVEAAM